MNKNIFIHLCRNPRDTIFIPQWIITRLLYKYPIDVGLPWFPFVAQQWLNSHLGSSAVVFEYGSGGSTSWISKRVKHLTTLEHDEEWFSLLRERMASRSNCTLILQKPVTRTGGITSSRESGDFSNYVHAISKFPDESIDMVLVDGRCRVDCVRCSLSKVKHGGYIVLDDSYRTEYSKVFPLLSAWSKNDFVGIRPFAREPSMTTIFIKP